jgi:hypothetical protein
MLTDVSTVTPNVNNPAFNWYFYVFPELMSDVFPDSGKMSDARSGKM